MKTKYVSIILLLFGLVYGNAHPGIGLVMDSKGTIYYTDLVHVWKIIPEGERSIAVKDVHTHELYIDENDDLYGEHEWYEGEATDKWGNYVWCLSSSGVYEIVIPAVEGFLDNTTLVRDKENNTYWTKKSGDLIQLFKSEPNGNSILISDHKFRDIRWMHYSKYDNHLYVIDHLKLKKISPRGDVTVISENLKQGTNWFNRVSDRHYAYGIWTDKEQNVFVALYGGKKVIQFRPDGNSKVVFESEGQWSPCSGLISNDGTMWLMEFSRSNTTRIRKIDRSGTQTVFE